MPNYMLPIEDFLVTKLQERFPDFDLREGTAFRDMLIKPLVVLMQPYRDQVNVLKRNQSLQNFEMMLQDEMDALTANLFVARRSGTKSQGSIRIYLNEPIPIAISTDVEFQTSDGKIFYATEEFAFTAEEVNLNIEGLFYFVDITAEAEDVGSEYNIDAHSIVFVAGGPDTIVKVDNLNAFALGVDVEDNATLYQRTKDSIAVRDLVTKRSISSVLLETFTTLREVAVAGYGDPEMNRDVISVIMELLTLFEDASSGAITSGTIFTDTTQNFYDMGVMPGHILIIKDSPNAGEYRITSVLSANSFEIESAVTNRTGIQYGIDGVARWEDYHIGGKVDIYLDSTKLEEKQVVLAPAWEENPVQDTDPGNYENAIAFVMPMVGVVKIIEIDPITREQIGTPLVEGTDYVIESLDEKLRYSVEEVVQMRLLQTNPGDPRYFIGSTLQFDYYADEMVSEVQTFVNNELNRVVTCDTLVRRCLPTFVDITLDYKGGITEEDLADVISEFVDGLSIGAELQVSDLIATVYFFDVNFVDNSVTVVADTHNLDGSITHQESDVLIDIPRTSKYIPRTIVANQLVT